MLSGGGATSSITTTVRITRMNRRTFLQAAFAAGVPATLSARQTAPQSPSLEPFDAHTPLVIERPRSGKPRAGQVVAAIQPHADDIPLFAAGTVFKLMDQGAKAYLNLENKAQGPAGDHGQGLRARLDAQGQRLPLLGADDASANRNYGREFVLQRDREIGERHGLTYAEQFHYIGPEQNRVEEHIRKNAIPR